jgi:hypothetical protein
MMATPLPDDVAAELNGLKQSGDGWVARCPTHEDRNPSLKLTVTDTGKVLVHCHAGCDQTAVLAALGLDKPGRPNAEWTPHGDATAIYDYRDEAGKILFQVLRTADKQFPQRRPDMTAKSGWKWSLGSTRRVLFRLPELISAVDAGQTVYVCEGEKDALALAAQGKTATCNPGGAGKWRPEYAEFLRGATVIVCADKDQPGQSHARTVAASLQSVDAQVWVVEALDPHKDVAAHLSAGQALDALTVTHRPDQPAKPDLAPDIYEFLNSTDAEYDWLVDGLLERGERLLLTGIEGFGKSTLTRQLAVTLAAGIHPFSFTYTGQPCRVLFIDCENPKRLNRRKLRPMVDQAKADGHPVPVGGLRIIHRTEGVDLTEDDDAAWLLERVTAHAPDILFIGSLYRLHAQNMNDELAARKMTVALDAARASAGCAVVVEAHSGHGEHGLNRSVRPTGSSLFMRWPEFGYGLKPFEKTDGRLNSPLEFKAWRGPRDERNWPEYVEHVPNSGWAWAEWYPSAMLGVV